MRPTCSRPSLNAVSVGVVGGPPSFHLSLPSGTAVPQISDKPLTSSEDYEGTETSGWDGIEEYVLQTKYDWSKRNDPCDDSYYHSSKDIRTSHNFIASNLGLIAKRDGNGKVHVIATDLRTAEAAGSVGLTLRNFQGQTLATATTNGDGFAELESPNTPSCSLPTKALTAPISSSTPIPRWKPASSMWAAKPCKKA